MHLIDDARAATDDIVNAQWFRLEEVQELVGNIDLMRPNDLVHELINDARKKRLIGEFSKRALDALDQSLTWPFRESKRQNLTQPVILQNRCSQRRVEQILPEDCGDAQGNMKGGLRPALRRMNETARDVNQIPLFKAEGIKVAAKLSSLIPHLVFLARQDAAMLLDLPIFGPHDLQYEDVMVVPVRRKTFAMRRRQIKVGLKAVTQLGSQHSAEQAKLGFAVMHLIQYQRASATHIAENSFQPLGRSALVLHVLLFGGIGHLNVVRRASDSIVKIAKSEKIIVIIWVFPMHNEGLPLPVAEPEVLLRDRSDKMREREVLEEAAYHET